MQLKGLMILNLKGCSFTFGIFSVSSFGVGKPAHQFVTLEVNSRWKLKLKY